MKIIMFHGRLNPNGQATDAEGELVDGSGFEGPTLFGVEWVHSTYGEMRVNFKSVRLMKDAKEKTGWSPGHDERDLELSFESDCLKIYNKARERHEYFGDWSVDP